jgi:hypothetical protein
LFKLFLLTSIFLPIWCEFTIHGGGEWQWVPFLKKKIFGCFAHPRGGLFGFNCNK